MAPSPGAGLTVLQELLEAGCTVTVTVATADPEASAETLNSGGEPWMWRTALGGSECRELSLPTEQSNWRGAILVEPDKPRTRSAAGFLQQLLSQYRLLESVWTVVSLRSLISAYPC